MKTTANNQRLPVLLCAVLMAAMALFAGCSDSSAENPSFPVTSGETISDVIVTLGQGSTAFYLTVTDQTGTQSHFAIHTDAETVGEALLELGLIEGEAGPYGLYVKTVHGITADYDTDKTYWAFYIDGDYAVSGVDQTQIQPHGAYELKVEQ